MKPTVKRGLFIAVEGADGSGKSTQAKVLAGLMHDQLGKTILTHEVGGTPIGATIRQLAFNKHEAETVDPLARLLMLYAARIQHIRNVLDPALSAGTHVVTDRYRDSTTVYQGHVDQQLANMQSLESVVCMRLLAQDPDITVYLKVNPKLAYARGVARANLDNTTYKSNLDMAVQVSHAYDSIMAARYKKNPGSVYYVDAEQSIENIAEQLQAFVQDVCAVRREAVDGGVE